MQPNDIASPGAHARRCGCYPSRAGAKSTSSCRGAPNPIDGAPIRRSQEAQEKPIAMHINLAGRRIYYDLNGPDAAPVVCFTHSLASDSGMWAEQMPPLLAAGCRLPGPTA
jgi:hypothetical protein